MTKQRKIRPAVVRQSPVIPLPAFSNRPAIVSHDAENTEIDESSAMNNAHQPNLSEMIGGRVLLEIAVDLIDPHPIAPREIYTQEMIAERAEDLRTQGQHDPIHVIPNPNVVGRYIICDGWTRVLACTQHKVLNQLLAEVHSELSIRESAWFGYQQNEGRTQQCDFDLAMFYSKLLANGESATEIARRHKRSKTQMSFYKAFTELPVSIVELVKIHKDKFGATAAYHLATLCSRSGEEVACKIAQEFVEDDKSVRWLALQTKEATKSPTKPAKNQSLSSKTVRYVNEFGNGVFKQKGNHFELSISVDPDRRESFSQAIENLLETVAKQQEAMG